MRYGAALLLGIGILVATAHAADIPKLPRAPVPKPAPKPSPQPEPPPNPSPNPSPPPDSKPHDPGRQYREERARQAVADAERWLGNAYGRLNNARDGARNAESNLQRTIEDQARNAMRLRQIDREEPELASQIRPLEQEAREQERLRNEQKIPLDEINLELAAVEHRVRNAVSLARSAAKTAERDYLQSPEWLQLEADIVTATESIASHRQRVTENIGRGLAYQELKRKAHDAELAVNTAREDRALTAAMLTPFSQKWIDTKSSMEAFERNAWKADSRQVGAEKELARATKARHNALEVFRQAIANHPLVLPHTEAFIAGRQDRSDVLRRKTPIVKAFAPYESRYRAAESRYQSAMSRLQQLRGERDRVSSSLASAEGNIGARQDDLARAVDEVRDAEREVQNAERRLNDARCGRY